MIEEQVLKKLEFDAVREMLAERCSSSLGRQLVARIAPSASVNMVKTWLGQVRELLAVEEDIGLPPMGSIRDIRQTVLSAARPAGIDADELRDVASTLSATGVLCRWAGGLPDDRPLLRTITARVGDLTPLADTIEDAVDERGRVRDTASPKLASIRATIGRAKDQIDIVFSRLLRHASVTRYLQYANATIHGDRRVLPLKAEHRGRINGIIHRSSDTGATLFVEPSEAVELNNTIVRLGIDEAKEIIRILNALSRQIHMNEGEILKTLKAVSVLDLLLAKVRFAHDFEARVPEISADGRLELRGTRHPVLLDLFRREAIDGAEPAKVVPIDVRLGDDFDVMVITGPNTGGKTVALKTVGLMALMTQSGVPIPVAAGSTLPVYREVLIDIGDEQSIEQSLSTFSSHLTNILDILRRAGSRSLVLLDELGSGTDPDEGAAIGRAVLDELLQLGVSGMITTHLSALKAVAFTEPRIDNASVEFDAQTLRPLYHLRIGEPGNSNALIIARRLGMSRSLIDRAQTYLNGQQRDLQKAIAGTLEARRKAERARADAHQARLDAERQRNEAEKRAAELDHARREHDKWVAWINTLRPGDEVFVRSFAKIGRIVRIQIQKQAAVVSAGSLEYEVSLQNLTDPASAANDS